MSFVSKCVACGRRVTWRFSLCDRCQTIWGRTAEERPEWLNYLISEAAKDKRYEAGDVMRSHEKSYDEIEGVLDSDYMTTKHRLEDVSYVIDIETMIEYKFYYAGFNIGDSDEEIYLQDSDWEAVYSYGV